MSEVLVTGGDKKSKWEVYVLPLLQILILPAVITLVGLNVTARIEQSKLDADYVKIAVGILSQPDAEQSTSPVLREWAVDVLNETSPVKLSSEQRAALLERGFQAEFLKALELLQLKMEFDRFAKQFEALNANRPAPSSSP